MFLDKLNEYFNIAENYAFYKGLTFKEYFKKTTLIAIYSSKLRKTLLIKFISYKH